MQSCHLTDSTHTKWKCGPEARTSPSNLFPQHRRMRKVKKRWRPWTRCLFSSSWMPMPPPPPEDRMKPADSKQHRLNEKQNFSMNTQLKLMKKWSTRQWFFCWLGSKLHHGGVRRLDAAGSDSPFLCGRAGRSRWWHYAFLTSPSTILSMGAGYMRSQRGRMIRRRRLYINAY